MTRVIVLYAKTTGPIVGVLQPVGPAQVPALPQGRTFRLPVGTKATYVQFAADQLAAAAVETSVTDPLTLFGYGVKARPQAAAGPPELDLVQLVSNAIKIVTPPKPTPAGGGLIKGHVVTGNPTGTLNLELWNAEGLVHAIIVPNGPTQTDFAFPLVEPGQYVVLAPGCEPRVVDVPSRQIP
jgi:hypothetical protein